MSNDFRIPTFFFFLEYNHFHHMVRDDPPRNFGASVPPVVNKWAEERANATRMLKPREMS